MGARDDTPFREFLAKVVPGSALREGLERILHAHMGALIVLGDEPDVLSICSGGFHLDAEMTPQRLSELAKMDGAIVLDAAVSRIAWANVHLVPESSVPTSETGTRHRTAERVARDVGVAVVAVSEEMGTITLYEGAERQQLEPTDALIGRANHLLQILRHFKDRFEAVSGSLRAAEIEDVVTVRDVATVVQRAEMVVRVTNDIAALLDELGEHGKLLRLQLDELVSGVDEEERLVLEDYGLGIERVGRASGSLSELSTGDLLSLAAVVAAIDYRPEVRDLDQTIEPRGIRMLRQLPQISTEVAGRLVAHFGDFHKLIRAPITALIEVTGMSEVEVRAMKAGIARLTESSILDRLG